MYRVIELMKTVDGTYIDRVRRYESIDGSRGAKTELWNFLYECTLDANLAYAHAMIVDDNGAVYKTDDYTKPVVEPETVVEE